MEPLFALLAGILSYLVFFKIGERHLYPFRYVQAFILAFVGIFMAKSNSQGLSTGAAMNQTALLAIFYFTGLYLSLIVYRLFFNPLNKFPGPYGARLSKFDFVFRVTKMDSHHKLYAMHQRYGKFVRIGPNDLSVSDPDGVQIVQGQNSKCTKAQWYSQDTPLISMHTTRDKAMHDRRRRIWSPAFSDKALRGYESRLQKYNDMLIKRMDALAGQPINASKWFNLYSFDVMGDLGFGKSFDMLESGKTHWAIKLLNAGMDPMGFGFPPWLFRVLIALPGAAAEYHRFIKFCSESLDNRMQMQGKTDNPDIIHTLIDHFNKLDKPTQQTTLPMLQGDSRLIIVAGSDTTAATLVHLFYYLASNKGIVQNLRNELGRLGADVGHIDHQKIQDAPLLNGCINEVLRLNPPVPSGVFRKTPKEGITIGDTYILGNTVIQIPPSVLGRDESCFTRCDEFIPERWSSKPDMIKRQDAFAPFSIGPFGCIGKNLAYMEIRLLTAQLIMQFDVALAPGEDGSKLLQKSSDHFTMGLADLELVFRRRTWA